MKVCDFEFKRGHDEQGEGNYYLHIRSKKNFHYSNLGYGVVIISDRPVKTCQLTWYGNEEYERLQQLPEIYPNLTPEKLKALGLKYKTDRGFRRKFNKIARQEAKEQGLEKLTRDELDWLWDMMLRDLEKGKV